MAHLTGMALPSLKAAVDLKGSFRLLSTANARQETPKVQHPPVSSFFWFGRQSLFVIGLLAYC